MGKTPVPVFTSKTIDLPGLPRVPSTRLVAMLDLESRARLAREAIAARILRDFTRVFDGTARAEKETLEFQIKVLEGGGLS